MSIIEIILANKKIGLGLSSSHLWNKRVQWKCGSAQQHSSVSCTSITEITLGLYWEARASPLRTQQVAAKPNLSAAYSGTRLSFARIVCLEMWGLCPCLFLKCSPNRGLLSLSKIYAEYHSLHCTT